MRTAKDIKILVACEESQTVCEAFRDRGFDAWSCDLQSSSNDNQDLHAYHIKGDALRALRSQDWDVVIAFPPCTYLSNAGARYLYKGSKDIPYNKLITLASGKKVITERYNKGLKGKEFFLALLNCGARYVAVENPRPDHAYELPKPSQIICPSQYGHEYTKTTWIWLKGLPCLVDTKPQNKDGLPSYTNLKRRPKARSKFHSGFSHAMACQWGDHILNTISSFNQSINQ